MATKCFKAYVRERGGLLVREETFGQYYRLVLGIYTNNAGTHWKHDGRFRRYHNGNGETVDTYMQSGCQSLAHHGQSKGVVASTNEAHLFGQVGVILNNKVGVLLRTEFVADRR